MAGCATSGVGFTVMVNVLSAPGQPAADGVTAMIALTDVVPLLTAVNGLMFPLPLAGKPIDVLLFVQLNVVPATPPVNVIRLVMAPLHTLSFAGCATFGIGLTVMVNVSGVPGQPAAVGVTVMVAVTGVLPLLLAVNAGIFPVPLAARPIEVLLFVQLKVVPAREPEKFTALVRAPSHNVWLEGCATFADGFTVMVNVTGAPVQVR